MKSSRDNRGDLGRVLALPNPVTVQGARRPATVFQHQRIEAHIDEQGSLLAKHRSKPVIDEHGTEQPYSDGPNRPHLWQDCAVSFVCARRARTLESHTPCGAAPYSRELKSHAHGTKAPRS